MSKLFILAAIGSLAVGACATTGATTKGTGGYSRAIAQGSVSAIDPEGLPSAEEVAAMETLTDVEFPPFAKEISAYCKRNLPAPPEFVAEVDGYADERQCFDVYSCARAVISKRYKYVEIDAENVPSKFLGTGKYRAILVEKGDERCSLYDEYVESLRENDRRRLVVTELSGCVAFQPIKEYTSRYLVKDVRQKRVSAVKNYLERVQMVIVDTINNRVVAGAGQVRSNIDEGDRAWQVSCTNEYQKEFVETVIPPKRD